MGCDIHTIAQIKVGDKWVTKTASVADDLRDYNSFAILAGVRNGYGFAGIMTGEGWQSIAEPRGLPEDVKVTADFETETPRYTSKWVGTEPLTKKWLGDHSFSWLLLSEIENYLELKMQGGYLRVGVLDRKQYEELKLGKLPTQWCGDISGGDAIVVSDIDYPHFPTATHVKTSWSVPKMSALYYLPKLTEALRDLQRKYGVEASEVRLVFGFDS
jgi:hypothetical protein